MPARPPPSIVMLQIVIRSSIESAAIDLAGVLDDVAGGAVGAHLADRAEDQVLGGDAVAELAVVVDPHRLRLGLRQRLGGEHVLDLARADAERERAERAVRGGVRVAADDRHAGLGDAELGPDDVHDPLAVGAERVERDAELVAVGLERLDLAARERVVDLRADRRAVGRHVVVGGGERAVRAADLAAGEPQALEGLRARDLVDEVEVDVDEPGRDLVRGPDLVEQRGGGHERRRPADTMASRTASSFPSGWRSDGAGRRRRSRSRRCAARARRRRRAGQRAALDARAVSRAPGSWRGGSPGPPVTAPGASVWRVTSARRPGSGGVRTS